MHFLAKNWPDSKKKSLFEKNFTQEFCGVSLLQKMVCVFSSADMPSPPRRFVVSAACHWCRASFGGWWTTCGNPIRVNDFHEGVSENRDTLKWMVYNGKTLLKLMIWGYHSFWKHPWIWSSQQLWHKKGRDLQGFLAFIVLDKVIFVDSFLLFGHSGEITTNWRFPEIRTNHFISVFHLPGCPNGMSSHLGLGDFAGMKYYAVMWRLCYEPMK